MKEVYIIFKGLMFIIITIVIIGAIYSFSSNSTHKSCPLTKDGSKSLVCGPYGVNTKTDKVCSCECHNNTDGANCLDCKPGFYKNIVVKYDNEGNQDPDSFNCLPCTQCNDLEDFEIKGCNLNGNGEDTVCGRCPVGTYLKDNSVDQNCDEDDADNCITPNDNYPKFVRDNCYMCKDCNAVNNLVDENGNPNKSATTFTRKCSILGIDPFTTENLTDKYKEAVRRNAICGETYTGNPYDETKFVDTGPVTESNEDPIKPCFPETCGDGGTSSDTVVTTLCTRDSQSVCKRECPNGRFITNLTLPSSEYPFSSSMTNDTPGTGVVTVKFCSACNSPSSTNESILKINCGEDSPYQDNVWETCPKGHFAYFDAISEKQTDGRCIDGRGICKDDEYLDLAMVNLLTNQTEGNGKNPDIQKLIDHEVNNNGSLCKKCPIAGKGEVYKRECGVASPPIISDTCGDSNDKSWYIQRQDGKNICRSCSSCSVYENGTTDIIIQDCVQGKIDENGVTPGSDRICIKQGYVKWPYTETACPSCFPYTQHTDKYMEDNQNLIRLNRCEVKSEHTCDYPGEQNPEKCDTTSGIFTGFCLEDGNGGGICEQSPQLWCSDKLGDEGKANCGASKCKKTWCGKDKEDDTVLSSNGCGSCPSKDEKGNDLDDWCSGDCTLDGEDCVSKSYPYDGESQCDFTDYLSGNCSTDQYSEYVYRKCDIDTNGNCITDVSEVCYCELNEDGSIHSFDNKYLINRDLIIPGVNSPPSDLFETQTIGVNMPLIPSLKPDATQTTYSPNNDEYGYPQLKVEPTSDWNGGNNGDMCYVYDGRGKFYGTLCHSTPECEEDYECIDQSTGKPYEDTNDGDGVCRLKNMIVPNLTDPERSGIDNSYDCVLNKDHTFVVWAYGESEDHVENVILNANEDGTDGALGCWDNKGENGSSREICDIPNIGVKCVDDIDQPSSCYIDTKTKNPLKWNDFKDANE